MFTYQLYRHFWSTMFIAKNGWLMRTVILSTYLRTNYFRYLSNSFEVVELSHIRGQMLMSKPYLALTLPGIGSKQRMAYDSHTCLWCEWYSIENKTTAHCLSWWLINISIVLWQSLIPFHCLLWYTIYKNKFISH